MAPLSTPTPDSHRTEDLTADAVVIGAGPNGLVAAIALADAGWDVLVIEEQPEVGGAVRTAEVTAPGFRTDLFSAFYPLAAASPVIRDLHLTDHGLQWSHSPQVLAHVLDDGSAAVLHRDPEHTAAALDAKNPGDGDSWLAMAATWRRVRDPLLDALFTPFPPVRNAARLLRRVSLDGGIDLARLAVMPVLRFAQEEFSGQDAALLLAGNAAHSDIPPDAAGSALFGWLLAMLGQDVGFPVPTGGAGSLAAALATRLEAAGGRILVGERVEQVVVHHGRAVGVRTGSRRVAARTVLADVAAPALYGKLLSPAHVPSWLRRDLRRFQWDHPTLKVNWALDAPVPWTSPHSAGTVHLGADLVGLIDHAADLATGRVPPRPFLLFGQMTTADPSRSPGGTESAWAYTHVPHGALATQQEVDAHVTRVEDAIERTAPGFAATVLARHVQGPADLEAANANLVNGAINGGTAGLHQQLIFRPTVGLGRPETPIEGLFLASASAHPGGGVHGACGWNAARAALSAHGPVGSLRRRLLGTAWARLVRDE